MTWGRRDSHGVKRCKISNALQVFPFKMYFSMENIVLDDVGAWKRLRQDPACVVQLLMHQKMGLSSSNQAKDKASNFCWRVLSWSKDGAQRRLGGTNWASSFQDMATVWQERT